MVEQFSTQYGKGDVVLVAFHSTAPDGTQQEAKRRPAVIVSGDRYHDNVDDVLVVPITTTARSDTRDVTIKIFLKTEEGQRAGLKLDSYVDCSVIATMPKKLLVSKLGSFSERTMRAIGECLKKVLELNG